MSKETPSQELLERSFVAKGVWSLVEHCRVEAEGRENLQIARIHLDGGGSLVVPFNHLALPDPGFVIEKLRAGLGKSMKRLAFPTSIKFLDGRMGPTGPIVKGIADYVGVEIYPVVQHYDDFYNPMLAVNINKRAIRSLRNVLETIGGVVALSPEGTRSRTGVMQEARRGIELIFPRDQQDRVLILPIGLIDTERIHRVGYPIVKPFAKVKVVFGEPFRYQEATRESSEYDLALGDILMLHIAEFIPKRYWGFYTQQMQRCQEE